MELYGKEVTEDMKNFFRTLLVEKYQIATREYNMAEDRYAKSSASEKMKKIERDYKLLIARFFPRSKDLKNIKNQNWRI